MVDRDSGAAGPPRGPARRLILRDHLALDRTALANERTFLAYVRTALTLIIAGITFVHFFETTPIKIVGWLFLPLGGLTLVTGWRRHRHMAKRMRQLRSAPFSKPYDTPFLDGEG